MEPSQRYPEPVNLFAISSSRVVTPAGETDAAIVIENGTIREVTGRAELDEAIPVTDFDDLVISPGLIDSHVHVNEPGRTEWEGFASATSAASAGGVTTIIDMPLNSSPVTTSVSALMEKRLAAAGKCRVDVAFYGGLIPGNEAELQPLLDAGVFGIKAFLCDSGLDEFPASGESQLRAALSILAGNGVPLLAHAEIVSPRDSTSDDPRSYELYADSRPPEFELAAIELLINLCREFRTPVHIVHLATAQALPMIAAAKAEGLPLTVETCPHYLYFSDLEIADGATPFKCAPPIRSNGNRVALCEAVTSGLIETIGSDHSPCPPELKRIAEGDFPRAWGGIAGLQLTLPVTWTAGLPFDWTPTLLAERLSARPAEVFGLKRKGKIEPGMDADLVVWDPESTFVVRGEDLFHRHSVTPYEGRELTGVVQQTFVRGRLVYDAGTLAGEPVGKLLSRSNRIANHLNNMSQSQFCKTLEKCCASQAWISRMIAGGQFADDDDVRHRAEESWQETNEADLLEAFSAHPKIGNVDSLREKFANTKQIAGGEQAGVETADEETLQRLAARNDEYFQKFGFIFIVFATGKTAAEMLDILESRISNDREQELAIAAAEQLKITLNRLEKLIG